MPSFTKGQLSSRQGPFRMHAWAVSVYKALRQSDGVVRTIRTFQSLHQRAMKMAARLTPDLKVPAMARVKARDIRS